MSSMSQTLSNEKTQCLSSRLIHSSASRNSRWPLLVPESINFIKHSTASSSTLRISRFSPSSRCLRRIASKYWIGKSVSGSNSPGSFSSNVSFSCIFPLPTTFASTTATSSSSKRRRKAPTLYSVPILTAFLVQFVPRHLDRLQLGLIRLPWVILELVQVDYPLAQIDEPHVQRIKPGMIFRQHLGYFFSLVPLQSHPAILHSV